MIKFFISHDVAKQLIAMFDLGNSIVKTFSLFRFPFV
jgi:hypothetical protein